MSTTSTASQQIEALEAQIAGLKHEALTELKAKLAEAMQNVARLERDLAELTGRPGEAVSAASRRPRRPSISDEELKPQIFKALIDHGTNGLNAKEIGLIVGQDPLRVRKFVASNPGVLKRQGAGPGTRFFLR